MTEHEASRLELHHVAKSFGGVRALDDVDASFDVGRVTCIIGPNGAGKTTLFNVATGFIRSDQGKVLYGGRCVSRLRAYQIVRLGVGRLFQDVRLFRHLSVLENVAVADRRCLGERPLAAVVWPILGGRLEKENRVSALRHLESVGLADVTDRPAEQLSYGQQKLVAIARLLNNDVQCMLLDEPTAGLSPSMCSRVVSLIRALAQENRTVVVIEHDLAVVRELGDWVYVMQNGAIKGRLTPSEVNDRMFLDASTDRV